LQLLILGHTFPEPTTTAAGGRMMQIIQLFEEEGYEITFACTAMPSERSAKLEEMDIRVESIVLNCPSFDVFISKMKPDVVLFDRYNSEEQFGWRVADHCPDAMRILDTEDLHFLRKARHEAVKQNIPVANAQLFTETTKRELASILRSDISLIISEVEMDLLQTTFGIPKGLLYYLPFLVEAFSEEKIKALPKFEERDHFVTIGNFQHAPNTDSVMFLKEEIWPRVKEQLPEAELHIYGAYAPKHITEMNNTTEGFMINGWTQEVSKVMEKARVCLAPLRFGAGLKGKLLDAMLNGTPSVTTSIGSEGLVGEFPFAGMIEDENDGIVNAAVILYSEKEPWLEAQQNGFAIVENRFQKASFSEVFKQYIKQLHQNLSSHRTQNFIGQILQHQSLQASKYLSKWIEEKSRKK
jgi:glycosyltransferase involved in cell wall biosynthesis